MASRQIAEADSDELATFLENYTSLAKKGQSESAAILLRAFLHVLMKSNIASGRPKCFSKNQVEKVDEDPFDEYLPG